MPFTKNIKTPKSVLAIGAHPDDMDFGAAGTLAKWAAAGAAITYLICTDGSKGSEDPAMTPRRLTAIRKKEQHAAAKIIGAREVIFLKHPDAELVANLALKEEITRVIRMKKPELVITLDPAFFYSLARGYANHPDHRAAGEAAMDAVFPLARDRLNFTSHEKAGLAPHKVKTLFLVSFDDPMHLEDISAAMPRKLAALKAHASQVGKDALARTLARAAALGKKAHLRHAEGFKRLDLV